MTAIDHVGGAADRALGSYTHAGTVTPHDTNELTSVTRGIWFGGAGSATLVTQGGETITLFNIPAGTELRVRAKIVKNTGTSSTAIVALW